MNKIKDVVDLLKISETSVRLLITTGKLGHLRVGQGKGLIRITDQQIEAYLKSVESGGVVMQPNLTVATTPPKPSLRHLILS